MPRQARLTLSLLASAAISALANVTWAQTVDATAAERLYQEGSELLGAGDFARACPKLDESLRLDPAPGAALALALCREREGKLASAVVAYETTTRLARAAGDEERATAAETRASSLRPRIPRVDVTLAPELRSRGPFVIVLDGEVIGSAVVTSVRIEVDAGAHVVEARAGALVSATSRFAARDGEVVTVEVAARDEPAPLPDAGPPTRTTSPGASPSRDEAWPTSRFVGLGALTLGAVGLGIGSAFAISGSSDADELERLGYDGERGTCRSELAKCESAYDGAAMAADASLALWIAGGALAAIGVTLVVWDGGDGSSEGSAAASAGLHIGPTGGALVGRY